MNIGWRTKYILALSEDFLIHRWKLSGTMGLAHGFQFHKKTMELPRGSSMVFLIIFCIATPRNLLHDYISESLSFTLSYSSGVMRPSANISFKQLISASR